MCEDSASFDLTSTDISLCISDVDTILKAKKEEIELSSGILYVWTHMNTTMLDLHSIYCPCLRSSINLL